MLEMNFEVLHHFLGSMATLFERIRNMYRDACQLSSTVGRQSLEFGQSGLTTAREARSRLRMHPLKAIGLALFALAMLIHRRLSRRRLGAGGAPSAALSDAFTSVSLAPSWR